MGAGGAGRHLREHGGQSRLAVVKFLEKSMTKLGFGRKAWPTLSFRTLIYDAAMVRMAHHIDSVAK
jgi:hypothetical protein